MGQPRSKRRLLLHAARAGDPQAQFELGCAYDFDAPKDRPRALSWYTKAAEQGNAEAQNFLGESHRDGWGLPQDQSLAVHWFRLAAAAGEHDAQVSLGVALFTGAGVEADPHTALRWYRKAAFAGKSAAMANIGHMYRCGDVVRQSWTLALRWYEKATYDNNVTALHWLARICNGQEDPPAKDEEAVLWLRRAARHGDAESQGSLGVRHFNGNGVRLDRKRAALLYRRAAEQGEPWSQYLLGRCYRDGEGVRRNGRVALAWFRRAALEVPEAARAAEELGVIPHVSRGSRGKSHRGG